MLAATEVSSHKNSRIGKGYLSSSPHILAKNAITVRRIRLYSCNAHNSTLNLRVLDSHTGPVPCEDFLMFAMLILLARKKSFSFQGLWSIFDHVKALCTQKSSQAMVGAVDNILCISLWTQNPWRVGMNGMKWWHSDGGSVAGISLHVLCTTSQTSKVVSFMR